MASVVFFLTVPRWFLWCSSSLFVRRWFRMWHLFCHYLFLISPSFGALGRLCFVIVAFPDIFYYIGIKHGFSCINIRQVPREVLKTEAGGLGFQHLPRDLVNVNALKNHVRSLLLHKKLKTFATFRIISCTILFRLFTDVSRMQFPWSMLVLGLGSTHLVMAANLSPWYNHIESCVAMH